jgi:hypothetical protein
MVYFKLRNKAGNEIILDFYPWIDNNMVEKGGGAMIKKTKNLTGQTRPAGQEGCCTVNNKDGCKENSINPIANKLIERSLKKHADTWRELAKH